MGEVKNLIKPDDIERHTTLDEAYVLYPDKDIVCIREVPGDINCRNIILLGVCEAGYGKQLRVKLAQDGVHYVINIPVSCRVDPMGNKENCGFVGVQF